MSFKEYADTDEHALDVEWARQSERVFELGESSRKATQRRDKLKQQFDLKMAELDIEIRTNPQAFGIDKITESIVKSTVTTDKKHQKFQDELLELADEIASYAVALKALDHKKKGLEYLSQLWMTGYYSNPNISKDAEQQTEKISRKKHTEGITKKLRRRKKEGETDGD